MRATSVQPSGSPHTSNESVPGKGLSRLLSAAVVNREFCNLLLANPAMAVATGYNGEPFDLAVEEQELIFSIKATSLTDLAEQLTGTGKGNGYHGPNHNGRNGPIESIGRNGKARGRE